MAELENHTESPGQLLVAARKQAGLSKADIAKQLNLAVTVINQLESDHYQGDIPDAFMRGYIRTYARALDLDEEKIVKLYSELTGNSAVPHNFIPSADVPPVTIQIGSHLLWFKLLSLVVVTVILVLGWMAYNQQSPSEEVNQQIIPGISSDPESNIIDLQATIIEQPEQENSPAIITNDALPTKAEIVEVEPVQGFIEAPQLTEAVLEFNFIKDCWVQIIDSTGEVLAVGLKTAGRRFTVSGVPPIKVVLGKPRAVSLQYNNQLVDLSIYPAGQTARFTLGEED